MTAVEILAQAVRVIIVTLKHDPAFSMGVPSLGPWRELEAALEQFEREQSKRTPTRPAMCAGP